MKHFCYTIFKEVSELLVEPYSEQNFILGKVVLFNWNFSLFLSDKLTKKFQSFNKIEQFFVE